MTLSWIRRILAPPVFEDEDKTHIAALLNTTSLALLALAAMYAIASLFIYPNPAPVLAFIGAVTLVGLGVLSLMRRGHVRLASVSLSFALWGIVTLGVFSFGGVRGPSFSGYFIVNMIAALLLGGRAGIAFAGLGIVAGLGIFLAETSGILPASPIPITPASTWTLVTATLIVGVALLHLATSGLNDALARAHRNERALLVEVAERAQTEERIEQLKAFNEGIIQSMAEGIVVEDTEGHYTFVNPAAATMLGYVPEELLGQHWTLTVPPDQQPIVQTANERRMRREADHYELEFTRKNGTRLPVMVSGSPLFVGGRFTGTLAVLTDITAQVQAEKERQRAKAELEKQNTRLRALYRVGQMINSTLETDAILDRLTDEAMHVTRATQGQVLVVREDIGCFERRSQRGFSPQEVERSKTAPLPLDRGINGRTFMTHQTVCVDDVRAEPGYFPLIPATRTELAVPIIRDGQVLGNLDLQSPEVGAFRDVDLDYLKALTDQVAIALENARLYEELRGELAERKAAEEALRASEERFTLAVEGSHDGIWDWDIANNTLYWSARLKELLGYADDELDVDFDTFESLLHPDDREQVEAAIEAHLKDRVPYSVEERLLTKSGEYRWYYIRGQAIWDKDEQPIRMVGSSSDITERKRAEQRLTAIHTLGQKLVFSRDVAEIAQSVVDAAKQVLHLPICSLWLVDTEQKKLLRRVETTGPESSEMPLLPLDGERGIVPSTVRSGEPIYLPDVSQDHRYVGGDFQSRSELCVPLKIGSQVIGALNAESEKLDGFSQADEQLLEALANAAAIAIENARLYKEVRQELGERVRAENQLKRYAAQLERSNRELEEFAYVASHDLQEPLRKVTAFGDRLKARHAEALDERGRDYLERMQNAAGRMQNLIGALLTYSRVTTRAQPFTSVDLARVVQEVISDLEVHIEQVGGRVEVGDLPTIDADPTLMRQLLQNLIGNALKFRREEEAPVIEIYAELLKGQAEHPLKNAPGDELCQIFVQDNGIGFDEKYLDRIFQVFQRLHGRGKYEGTGVGLAICRKIAERHGGSITAKSTPGQGATFIFTLPIRQRKGENGR